MILQNPETSQLPGLTTPEESGGIHHFPSFSRRRILERRARRAGGESAAAHSTGGSFACRSSSRGSSTGRQLVGAAVDQKVPSESSPLFGPQMAEEAIIVSDSEEGTSR